MKWPVILLIIAVVTIAVAAYGVQADWAQYSFGLALICISRRLMWPLVGASLLSCLALLGLVITGRSRAWWLIGLAPVLALFVHRFGPGAPGPAGVVEGPLMLDANDRSAPEAGDYVVGVVFSDRAYAFPYRALFDRPIVALTDYDKRMLLMWSAYANRAIAVALTRDLRARDLEIVSSPANAVLIYDRRLGQFICGVTGRLLDGGEVVGFSKPIETRKLTWSEWKSLHPDTKVMAGGNDASLPRGPILPRFKLRVPPMPDPATPVSVLSTDPLAAAREDVPMDHPINVTIGSTRVLIVRDAGNRNRAYDRHLKEDLFLSFGNPRIKKKGVAMTDVETRSSWTLDGRCIDGELKGQKLRPIDLDDRLYWGVMKFWYPQMQLIGQ